MRLLPLLITAGIGVALGLAIAGAMRDGAPVVVRHGEPMLPPGPTALIALRGEFVAEMVREALEEADMPFRVEEVETEFTRTGVGVSGRVAVSAAGVEVRQGFSAVVQPMASSGGTIEVRMNRLRAGRANLPGAFEEIAERVINARLREATRVEGYRVTEVEVGQDELLVYLEREG